MEQKAYRKSSIRSRPCIILNPKFPRVVLEVFQLILILELNFLLQTVQNDPNRAILKDLKFFQQLGVVQAPLLSDL